jgi:hypothetical protein
MSPPSDPPAMSAPDLIGPTSFLSWPTLGGRGKRKSGGSAFSFVRIEVDLRHERLASPSIPIFQQLEALVREQRVVEAEDLLRSTALLLHALSARGFRTVYHWEVRPGGWLPLPEPTHPGKVEPVGHLLKALESDQWRAVATAREFAVRLAGGSTRVDATVRRVHRERGHSISLELRGRLTQRDLHAMVDGLRDRLPVLRARVSEFERV